MLTRRVALLQQCSRLKTIYSRKSTKAKLDQTELAFPEKLRFPMPKPKLQKTKPFLKELFVGKFDAEMLTYPEPQPDQRSNEFNDWLRPIEDYVKTLDGEWIYNSRSFSEEMREKLKEFGIYGGRIPYEYDGLNLLESEYLRLIEVLSTIPKLGINFIQCNNYPVELLKKDGTIEQKHKYLRQIASGYYCPIVCANESNDRIDPECLNTNARLSHDEKSWILSGQKLFVQQDNNANLFIVYAVARVGGDRRCIPETLSTFIVEKTTPGVGELISVKSPWLGMENMFSVNFNDVVIPYENIIGEVGSGVQSLENYYTRDLHFSTGVYISCLKNFLNSLIKHVIRYDMHEREGIKRIISNISTSIYAMESIAYLTTSIADLYEGQDLIVEQAIAKEYCSKECIARLTEGFQILDAHLCATTFPFEQVIRNQMFALQNNCDLKTYIGLLGVQYAGVYFGDDVKKMRNPYDYPGHFLKKVFGREEKFPSLNLLENLHPSYENYIGLLEESIGRIKKSIREILIRHGAETVTKEIDMHRISEMASLIYAITACFGRASRSYCIGLEGSDFEMQTAIAFSYDAYYKIKSLYEQIDDGDICNGNIYYPTIANRMYELKKYMLENPLKKNW